MKFIKWLIELICSFFKKDKVKEVQDEANEKVDKIDDGDDMSDFLNKQLRK